MTFFSGLLGVIVGAVLQFFLDRIGRHWDSKQARELDHQREKLLLQALKHMPEGKEWRKLSTLCGIVGADPQTTTRLLIKIGARGSESEKDVWALIKDKPLSGAAE